MPSSHRFTRPELELYFDRIRLPRSSRIFNVSPLGADEQLSYLTLLQKHQLVYVPFENLVLHYSWHRVVNVEIRHLFDKIVNQRRGGYCLENNSLFHTVLVTLGFDVYLAPGRVHIADIKAYTGLTHCLNIITLPASGGGVARRYAVDVGFGANEPSRPCLMESGLVQDHILPGQMRLRHDVFPGAASRESGKVWFYEVRTDESADWMTMYCFLDVEIFPQDAQDMNWGPSQSKTIIFRKTILCVVFTAETQVAEGGQLRGIGTEPEPRTGDDFPHLGDIDGAVILLGGNLKWRRKGKKVMERDLKTDGERLAAVEEYLGLFLSPTDKDAIAGTATALSG